MKLWLLDADVIIDLLSLDFFDKLAKSQKVFAASTVISEVRFFKRGDKRNSVDLQQQYVSSGLVKELSASPDEIKRVLAKLPVISHASIDSGELESLAILEREEDLIFCSCDAAAIRTLPFIDLPDRGISVESLLKSSGLQRSNLKDRHTEQYFKNNLAVGQESKIYLFTQGKGKQQEVIMAKNKPYGDGHRIGAVNDRSQVHNPHNDRWVKRDDDTGRFIDQKSDDKPFKGVRKEK